MATWCGGSVKITSVNGTSLPSAIFFAYEEFTLRLNPQLVEAGTVLHVGTRSAPTKLKPMWSCKIPWDDTNLPEAQQYLVEGNVLTMLVCLNPTAATIDQIIYTITETTVGEGERATSTKDIHRFSYQGEGGDTSYPGE